MTLQIDRIAVVGEQFAIHWNDGAESFFSLEELRLACPCAACGGEPDVLGRVNRPSRDYNSSSFKLQEFGPVGGYGLQFRWADGHSTGIYSFAYLRRLSSSTNE